MGGTLTVAPAVLRSSRKRGLRRASRGTPAAGAQGPRRGSAPGRRSRSPARSWAGRPGRCAAAAPSGGTAARRLTRHGLPPLTLPASASVTLAEHYAARVYLQCVGMRERGRVSEPRRVGRMLRLRPGRCACEIGLVLVPTTQQQWTLCAHTRHSHAPDWEDRAEERPPSASSTAMLAQRSTVAGGARRAPFRSGASVHSVGRALVSTRAKTQVCAATSALHRGPADRLGTAAQSRQLRRAVRSACRASLSWTSPRALWRQPSL
jgi:hypothetical protein